LVFSALQVQGLLKYVGSKITPSHRLCHGREKEGGLNGRYPYTR
jgi:hypothetical protein